MTTPDDQLAVQDQPDPTGAPGVIDPDDPAHQLTYEERLIIANRARTRKRLAIAAACAAAAAVFYVVYWIGALPQLPSLSLFASADEDPGEEAPVPEFNPAPFLTLEDEALIKLRNDIARQSALLNASYETDTDKAAITAVEFLTARTIDERLPWVRQPERVAPLMREYYARPGSEPSPFRDVIGKASLTVGGREVITISYRNADHQVRALALLREGTDEGGRFLVDWESHVCYSELSIERFVREKPTAPTTFRLYVNIGDYYNFGFSDETAYQSLTLTDRDKTFLLYGFAPRDAPWLDRVFRGRKTLPEPRPLTVQISFPESAEADNCVRVDDYLTAWWFAP